uniref:Hypothetical chloroplast RF19 n=2 Tax=Hesperocyparis TaxID=634378 RepID=A0A346JKC2_HESAR|nr:hypothetical chloroplast RF1 [Hesperocyparis glabra]YP_009520736.1 hypothetical chloroplast RF19 [Hesperocyparis arizonica]AJE71070.1 hypothetical chloroplast RF1 [Hesperocyparis glabra]AXP34088.1 hypothetical chloroplast RF19 [Hesperocyparis arizonica]
MINYIIPWVGRSTPVLLFGVYYGFLATLPIGPAQMYFIRSMLIQNKVVDNRKIVPAGNLILSGSFVAQLVVFSSIYVAPIYASIWKPHLMTIMLVPVLFFLVFQRALIRRYPWLQNPAIEFFIGVALQLLNPALFGKSIYTRLINLMLFRYSGNFLFLLSTAAGWLSGQILFVKMTKIFCSRVENDVPLKRDRKGELFAFSFQIIFFGYAMLACYGRNPSFIATKWNDSRTFIQGPREELEELSLELSDKKKSFRSELKAPNKKKKHKKHKPKTPINIQKNEENANKPSIPLSPSFRTLVRILSLEDKLDTDTYSKFSPFLIKRWPLILFDSNRFNDPLRYVSIGDYILRGPVRSQVAEYFFDICISDGHQKISFTAPPSISFFAKMANLGDQSLDSNQDHLDEWIEKKWERKTSLGEELENRVRALSNGSPVVKILEKKIRFSKTKDKKRLSEVDDPLLSGPFRGSMNQFKSPWMLYSEEHLKEQKKKLSESKNQDSTNKNHDSTNKNDDSTNQRFSLIRPENKERIVQPRIKLISKWWIDKIRMVLLEEQNRRKWLDESTLEDLKKKYDKIYPKNLSSLEYVFNTLVPAPLKKRIEKDIASCEKKLLTNYLLHIFLETTGTKWELLLSVLPTEQALLYEQLFFINSDGFSNSQVSMDIEISEKDILKDFADILEEDRPSSNKEHTKDKKHKSDKSNIHLDEYFFEKEQSEQDMKDFADFHELYVLYSKLIEQEKTRLDDYEPRIRDFNRFVVPKLPSTLLSGVHDPIAVKDCLETRPKKARQLIIIKPFDKLEELEKKKQEEERKKNEALETTKKGLFKPLKEKVIEEEETFEQEEANKEGDEEEDLVSKDIYVFSYPYEGDFRRDLVKGAVRFQRRKVSAINHWIPRPESILFGRLKSMTQKSHHKPVPKKDEKKRITARSRRLYDKFLERRERRKEDRRRRTQQTFDGEVIHYVRAALLFTHTYLRKRLYFPTLIIAKNIGRTLLFQVPEWEQDWFNLEKESYLKCNYDGYELTDPDVPKKFLKDYIKEGIQIKIVYPFRLKPWYESNSANIEKKTTGYLTIYGTEIESPFGNPPNVPSFWEPIGEWIWNYTSDRAKPIIEPIRELIELIQKNSETINEKVKTKINLDTSKEINLDTSKESKIIRTRPTSNIQFSLEIVEDEHEPFSIQMEQNLDLPDPDDWTITMNDRINQMNEEYRFNLDIYNKLKADFKQRMDQPSPNIKSKLKKEWIRIKIWRSCLQKKSLRFIRKKLPFFMKVIHFRVKLLLIDLKISMFNMIESNLEFCMQLSRSFETMKKIFNSNHPISKNVESKCQGKEISQAYVFHQIWKEIRNMKGFYAQDLLESRASSPFIKKNVKEFLDSQGILDCKHPRELTTNHWKQWLKWCAGYRIDRHRNKKRKHVIGNRLGWTEFASFLGEKRFASFMTRLKNRIKRHRYDLLAYSYLDHMKENNHGPAIQYIPEPDYQAITNFQNPGSFKKKKKKKKKNDSSWKKFFSSKKKKNNCDSSKSKKRNVDFCAATKKTYYKKSRYYKFQFWLFPDLRKKIKNANKLGDVFPPNIIRRQIEEMWKFREIQVPKDFDVDAFVIESLRKKEEERRSKAAALQELKEARRKRKEERLKTREERRKKLESATSPEEVDRLTRTFKIEDDQNKKERRRESKKRLLKEQRIRQLAKIAAQKAKELKREERKRKLAELSRKRKSSKKPKNSRDFLVRDFCNNYYPKINIDKINIEKEEVRMAIKEIILRQDAKKASQGDKKAWDRVKSKLDEKYKNKKVGKPSETKTKKPKKDDEQEIDFRTAKTEYLKEQKRLQREAKRLAREEELKEEMKLKGEEEPNLEKERLAYREMAKNIYTWRMKFELEKLPLTPWVSKFRNASRFFDKKKLGGEAAVASLLFPYAENGDLDLELLETVLYLKSVFPKHNDIRRVFCEAARRSMPLVPGYFNDRFFVYKIASLLFKLKKKKINVNLFDRSQRRINEKISSSFIFEDLFLPRRRREFRILNLLNLENHLDESARFSSQEIPNDQGLIKKNEHLIVDTRQKIRRFLWPRYRLEDLICMNRFWWNTNNGSRSAMLRVRMYPKIDHWEHIQNNLYFLRLKHSFISIREIVQKFGNHAKSLLDTKQSPIAGQNEVLNEVKHKKEDSFCSISSSLPSDPSPYNELLTILRKIISSLRDSIREWIGSLLCKLRDFLIKRISSLRDSIREWIGSLLCKLRDFLIKRISSLKDFIIKSMRELFSKLKLQLKRFLNPLKKKLRKLIDPPINKLETQRINFIRFLKNLINEIRVKLVNFLSSLRDIIDRLLVKLEKPKPRRFSRWISRWEKIQNSRVIFVIQKCLKAYQFYDLYRCLVEYWRSSRR